jgi:NADH-quinone oxidoreductase subunit A
VQFNLINVLVFLLIGVFFIAAILLVGRLVRPRTPDQEKNSTYECGERPIAQAWFNFNPRFYIVAIIFLIFDVEVAFTYPVATVYRRWAAAGAGAFAFFELLVFLAIVAVGLGYVWAKGDLEWLKTIKTAVDARGPLARAARVAPVEPVVAAPPSEGVTTSKGVDGDGLATMPAPELSLRVAGSAVAAAEPEV